MSNTPSQFGQTPAPRSGEGDEQRAQDREMMEDESPAPPDESGDDSSEADGTPTSPLALLYAALRESGGVGLLVRTGGDFDRHRARLYKARRESGDGRLNALTIGAAGKDFAGEGDLVIFRPRKDSAP